MDESAQAVTQYTITQLEFFGPFGLVLLCLILFIAYLIWQGVRKDKVIERLANENRADREKYEDQSHALNKTLASIPVSIGALREALLIIQERLR